MADDSDCVAHAYGADAQPKNSNSLQPTCKKEITILLIGETGAGKTAFMSLLLNLFMNHGPYDLEERNKPEKEQGGDKSQSQTNEATLYYVKAPGGTTIRILDTPGLADTRGIEQDAQHKEKINKAIEEHVQTLDAVFIMANGTVQRLGAATDYTLNAITAMFPFSIIENICLIFTHTDELTFNFQKESLQPELRNVKHWLIQNPLPYSQNYKKKLEEGSHERALQRWSRSLEEFYVDAVSTLNELLGWLDSRDVQPSNEINELYVMSNNIEAEIERVLTNITRMHDERVSWERIQEDLRANETSKAALEKMTEDQITFWDRQATERHNTLCIYPECHSVCHEPCNLMFTTNPGGLGWCRAFDRAFWKRGENKCKRCHHDAQSHRHYHDKWVERTRDIPEKTKLALESAKTQEERLKAAERFAQSELEKLDREMKDAQARIRPLVQKYNLMALSKNFAGHIHSAISMLEFRKKALQARPNTKAEIDLIDESIAKFNERLQVLELEAKERNAGKWDQMKGVFWSK